MSNHKKSFFIDTNILLDNPNCIDILKNGEDNQVYIPYNVLVELDNLKKETRFKHLVSKVVDTLIENFDKIIFLKPDNDYDKINSDHKILKEVESFSLSNKILVSNDKLFRLFGMIHGIKSEELRESIPFTSESQKYTGFLNEDDEFIPNHFKLINNIPTFFKTSPDNFEQVTMNHKIWKVESRNLHQNLAFQLLLDDNINLITIQSNAGYGKTYLSLAAAFYKVLEKSLYNKIYVIKPTVELGQSFGFLPGDLDEKTSPFFRSIDELVLKLDKLRNVKIFLDSNGNYDKTKFEILPINFMRGMNIDNGFVIIDEVQNISRNDIRTLLTRMGKNVKCVALGDTNQVDHPYLNQQNNGLNWIVKLFKGQENYGHIVLKGNKSRGPITDMALDVGL